MQVTSLLTRHDHDASCATCGHDHEHAPVRLWQTLIGIVFVINAFVVDWLFAASHAIASAQRAHRRGHSRLPHRPHRLKDLRRGIMSMNELVAIAVLAACASGEYKTAGVVAFFMLMGEIVEPAPPRARAPRLNRSSNSPPPRPALKADKTEEEVPASELAIGDVIRVRPGDNVAADGVIVSGQGSFNQATITGESLPWTKNPATTFSPAPKI